MRPNREALRRELLVVTVVAAVFAIALSAGATGAFASGDDTEDQPFDRVETSAWQTGDTAFQQSENETGWQETVTGRISNEQLKNPWDSFRLDATAGDTITAELNRTGGSGTLYVIVTDQAQNVIASTPVEPNETAQVSAIAETSAEYGVFVQGAGASDRNVTGNYSLTVSVGDIVEPDETVEPEETVESDSSEETDTGTEMIESGESVEGEIVQGGEGDLYSFEGEAGDEVSFELSRTDGEGKLYLGLYNQTVENIGFIGADPGATEQIRTVLPASGTYYVFISGSEPDGAGAYTLTMNEAETPISPPGVGSPEDNETS